jgi:uncharacterized phiE125 gp8 family phage protein
MSEFVEFLPPAGIAGEPVSVLDLKGHARWDVDNTLMDAEMKSIYIPGARQLAETRTGSAIRPARYVQRLRDFPKNGGSIAITHGMVMAIESITYASAGGARLPLELAAIESAVIEREMLVEPTSGSWPDARPGLRGVEITYTAGITQTDMATRFPSVRQWILMAAAWALDQPELFVAAKGKLGYQELPADYLAGLLDPITIRSRF